MWAHFLRTSAVSCSLLLSLSLSAVTPAAAQDAEQLIAQHFRAGQQAAAQNQFDRAIAEFKAVLKLDPSLVQARANLGLMYYSSGRFQQAAGEMLTVVREAPELLPGQLFLGLSYLNSGQPLKAIPPLKKAIEFDSANAEARRALVECYLNTSQYRPAYSELANLAAASAGEDSLYFVGQAYLQIGTALTSELAQRYGASAWAHRLAGDLAADRGEWLAALQEFQQASSSGSGMAGLTESLAAAQQKAAAAAHAPQLPTVTHQETARVYICSVIDAASCVTLLEPKASRTFEQNVALGGAYFLTDHFSEAANVLLEGARQDTDAEVLYWLIRTFTALGSASFAQLEAAFPDSGRVHELHGQVDRLKQDFTGALTEFEAAANKLPDDAEIRRYWAEMMLLLDKPAEAEVQLENAAALRPNNAQTEYLLAQVALKEKRLDAAIEHLKASEALDGSNLAVHALLGSAYLHSNKPSQAVPELERAQPIDFHGDLSFQLYKAYKMIGNTGAASKALARSKELRKSSLESVVSKISGESSAAVSSVGESAEP